MVQSDLETTLFVPHVFKCRFGMDIISFCAQLRRRMDWEFCLTEGLKGGGISELVSSKMVCFYGME